MKATRKLTALLAVLGLLMTLWVPATVAADTPAVAAVQKENDLYFGRSILAKMDNSKALCYAYDKLVNGLREQQETIDIAHRTYEIGYDEAESVWRLVMADHPEFFWTHSVGYTGDDDTVTTFYGYYNEEELAYKTAVDHRVEQLTAGLEGKSDYEKSLILHDRLCDAVVYEFSEHNQTVIGSLVLGASVCAGYAHAYQMLLQEVGIPCFYVVGHSRNQGHAWNLVQLDGEWYYTDVTWDDQNDDEGGTIYYAYLNNTYEQISEDHTAEEWAEYLPRTTATTHNYYVKSGLILEEGKDVDVKKLAKAFKENYPPQLYYTGDEAHEGAMLIFQNLGDIVREIMGKSYGYSASVGMLGHGLVVYLEINHPHNYADEIIPGSCTVGGTKTSRCSDCGYTVKEHTPATGHDFSGLWQDAAHHGTKCAECGIAGTLEEHTYEQGGSTCDTCGYVSDVCHHRYVDPCGTLCTYCGEAREAQAEHTYDGDRDADCDLCGEERELPEINYGDASGDGKVNNRDLGLLQRFLNEWDVDVYLDACDVNDDGRVNNRDLGILQRKLNE